MSDRGQRHRSRDQRRIRDRQGELPLILELLALLVGSVGIFVVTDPVGFRTTTLVGVLLAIVLWFGCARYTSLWNKRYRMNVFHHVLCAAAALITVSVSILYPAVGHIRKAEEASIAAWQATIGGDSVWAKSALRGASEAVRRLGIEDFKDAPPDTSSWIPTSHDESRQAAAGVYVSSAWDNFVRSRLFLGTIVSVRPGIPAAVVFADVKRWQQTNPTYPPQRAIDLAVEQIRSTLEAQTQQLVTRLRVGIVTLFVLVQAAAFGFAGWAAYRDIKVRA